MLWPPVKPRLLALANSPYRRAARLPLPDSAQIREKAIVDQLEARRAKNKQARLRKAARR